LRVWKALPRSLHSCAVAMMCHLAAPNRRASFRADAMP
jgi:hypothetical protein